jgi:hypothetical protein
MNRWADYVIGYGDVGKALYDVIASSSSFIQIVDRDKGYDIRSLKEPPKDCTVVLHICFPWRDGFYDMIEAYVQGLEPDLIIIHSTVMPGKAPEYQHAVYSPIRGQHDNLTEDIKAYSKYIACLDVKSMELARMRLDNAGLKVKNLGDNVHTLEWAKHLSNTLYYHWILAYRQMAHQWCQELELDEELLWGFTKELHARTGIQYPSTFDPKGIGGHCVVQNSELLLTAPHLPDSMESALYFLLEINERIRQGIQ